MKLFHGQLLVALAALAGLAGCASIGPPVPPSLELPHPPSELRVARKGEKVTLTWTVPARTTDRQSVRYLGQTRICRSVGASLVACGVPVAEVSPPADFGSKKNAGERKVAARYVDNISPGRDAKRDPFATATYAVEVLNRNGRSAGLSNQAPVSLAETLVPPADFVARLTGQGVELSWTGQAVNPPQSVRFSYRVFRRAEGSQQRTLVGEVEADGTRALSLTDQSFEWEMTYYYHADTLTMISQAGKPDVSVEGDDTAEVKVVAHDVFPPGVPQGLQAVFSGIRQQAFIDLVWAPVTDSDLDGYNVYRREEGGDTVKVNSELVKTPAYRDMQVAPGRKYFYSVSAVDLRGNESARSEEAGESVGIE
jgi:fibronectin type 3 domain-containing protein